MKPDTPATHTPATFAVWLKEQLRRRGYPEHGAQKKFAAVSGISTATMSRLFRADGIPALDTLTALSEALDVPYGELLVRAGVLTPEELAEAANRPVHPEAISPEQAARELGITSPEGVETFKRMVNGLRATEPGDRRASG
ncbi:helix-turn-helix transcriptional regulator [Streptomyces sp. VNUA116]|uniref:helix-turn-helix domain-containing protein n=1 Tax=Streptomyces sp. VNUA116 TaxID=3062449 RepID=UPI0026745270|nr:helix-turn-helix transcriptional regulator [Streptomyces sp. VNUA116]WKU46000.1 helix-turn-helix transcriptional regulator [Streptomyces sp. VNUA116]